MLDYEVVAEALLRLNRWWSANDVWDCGMAFTIGPTFEEAYEIRAAIIADKAIGIGQARKVAHAFCDRALLNQGVAEDNMFFMGYGCERNAEGVPNCSCIADAASSAVTILDTVKAYPDSLRAESYIGAVRKYADYVLDRYTDPNGVTGVGILGHQINPWSQYWCACALFSEVLLALHELTMERKYLDAIVGPLSYLADYDYRGGSDWKLCSTEVIMYAGEGVISGLASESADSIITKTDFVSVSGNAQSIGSASDPEVALNQMRAVDHQNNSGGCSDSSLRSVLLLRGQEFVDWLYSNQEVTGIWQDSKDYRCYQLGLTWLLLKGLPKLDRARETELMVDRQMRCMIGTEGITYHGLFCRPFATALAHFSAAAAGAFCMSEDNSRFEDSMRSVQRRLNSSAW